jgi:hypothetical protein
MKAGLFHKIYFSMTVYSGNKSIAQRIYKISNYDSFIRRHEFFIKVITFIIFVIKALG